MSDVLTFLIGGAYEAGEAGKGNNLQQAQGGVDINLYKRNELINKKIYLEIRNGGVWNGTNACY